MVFKQPWTKPYILYISIVRIYISRKIKKPFIKDHFTINVHSGKEKESVLEKLKNIQFKKIIDKGHKLIIYPEHVKDTMNGLLNIINDEGLHFFDMDVRKPTLNEVFEKIALDDSEPKEEEQWEPYIW